MPRRGGYGNGKNQSGLDTGNVELELELELELNRMGNGGQDSPRLVLRLITRRKASVAGVCRFVDKKARLACCVR